MDMPRYFTILVVLLGGLVGWEPQAAPAQPGPTLAAESGTVEPNPTTGSNRRIIILGTRIVGSIAEPGVVYEVPWKDPESLRKQLDEPQRSFQEEIFELWDRGRFEPEFQDLERPE